MPTPAETIVAQPDHEATCLALARLRGQLEDLLASPGTPATCRADLADALVFVRRAHATNSVAWASTPDDADAWEPSFDPDDPYAPDGGIPFELTPEGLAAAAGVG